MDFVAGGLSKFLDLPGMPAPLANKRKKGND
jgi:hypothetical protein